MVYVCVAPNVNPLVEVTAPAQVEVDPARQGLKASDQGEVALIEVTVTGGEGGSLEITVDSEAGGGTAGVPIEVDDESWSFDRP